MQMFADVCGPAAIPATRCFLCCDHHPRVSSCFLAFPPPPRLQPARLCFDTHMHTARRWKEKSSSITCITPSCSDQLTTTKCPRKSIFSPWDLSAVLTSNFIFIDHSLFSSIWSVAARRAFDILPCTIKVDNMPLWQESKSMFSWIHPAFQRLILLWKVCIYVESSGGKELERRTRNVTGVITKSARPPCTRCRRRRCCCCCDEVGNVIHDVRSSLLSTVLTTS